MTLARSLPGLLLILATAVMLVGLPFGLDPLWRVEPLTLAEAAALRDNGEVVRLIDAGEDPNKAGTVRAELLRNDPLVVTPLEAAVGSDRADMIEVLLDNGAVLDAMTWTLDVLCNGHRGDDVRALLEQRRPDGASPPAITSRSPLVTHHPDYMSKRRICVLVTARPSYSRIRTALQRHPGASRPRAAARRRRVGAARALRQRRSRRSSATASRSPARVYMVLEGENLVTSAKSTGLGLVGAGHRVRQPASPTRWSRSPTATRRSRRPWPRPT